jgi:catechol 2,3-dioxygenase-like lactoylglutathione lyase family enzyme
MKRFHVHAHVEDLQASIAFYSRLFAAAPTRVESDYAKWMLDDPRINFALSSRGATPGLNHLGLQVEEEAELGQLRGQLQQADISTLVEDGAACCYARSDKHWVTDPQGIPWETFRSLGRIPVFGQAELELQAQPGAAACCVPGAARSACA